MAYSRVVAIGNGSATQFTVNFALDYISTDEVTCRVGTETTGDDPAYRTITFLSENLIQVGGPPAGDGVHVTFERTVPKDTLLVDYNNGDELAEDNLMIAQKQAMMAIQEGIDGRWPGGDIAVAAAATAVAAEAVAVEAREAAVAAASVLGNATTLFDTRANAIASTNITTDTVVVRILGRNSAKDLGGGVYMALSAAPTTVRSWHFQNTPSGVWFQLLENVVNPRMFNAAGNGTTDDIVPFFDAGDYISSLWGGGMVVGVPTDTYRCVINSTVTDLGLVLHPNVDYSGRLAKVRLECTKFVYGARFKGRNIKFHGWDHKTAVSADFNNSDDINGARQKAYHTPLNFGTLLGDSGTIVSPSPFLINDDCEVYDCIIDSVRNNGQGSLINGDGGGDNISIHDNIFPNNSTVCCAISLDWNFLGPLDEGDLNASKTAYNAGTMYTVHYTRLTIKNNRIGQMFMPMASDGDTLGGTGIRLSGVISFNIEGNNIEGSFQTGIRIHGGDVGVEYAKETRWRIMFGREWVIRNNIVKSVFYGDGIQVDCYGDNIYRAVLDATNPQYPYTSLYVPYYPCNVVIEGNFIYGDADTAQEGISLLPMIGGTVRNNTVFGMTVGVRVNPNVHNAKIVDGNDISNCLQEGILVQNSTGDGAFTPRGNIISRNRVYQNNRGTGGLGNIRVDFAIDTLVSENEVGLGDVTSDGIINSANSTYTKIKDNVIHDIKSGGTAVGLSLPYSTVFVVSSNRLVGGGVALSGLDIIPFSASQRHDGGMSRMYRANASVLTTGDGPTSGSWSEGDIIYYDTIDPEGNWGAICTTGGAVGAGCVFKTLSGINA